MYYVSQGIIVDRTLSPQCRLAERDNSHLGVQLCEHVDAKVAIPCPITRGSGGQNGCQESILLTPGKYWTNTGMLYIYLLVSSKYIKKYKNIFKYKFLCINRTDYIHKQYHTYWHTYQLNSESYNNHRCSVSIFLRQECPLH